MMKRRQSRISHSTTQKMDPTQGGLEENKLTGTKEEKAESGRAGQLVVPGGEAQAQAPKRKRAQSGKEAVAHKRRTGQPGERCRVRGLAAGPGCEL